MNWKEFYDHFYEWSDSTQIRYISKLTTFGPHEEVAEIIQMYVHEKDASRLAKKAMQAGVRFTPQEIVEIQGNITKECMNQMVTMALGDFTQEQVEDLVFTMDEDIYEKLENKYCNYNDEETEEEEMADEELFHSIEYPQKSSISLFSFASLASSFSKGSTEPQFQIGDCVIVKYRGQEGIIIDINGNLYMVRMNDGRRIDSYPASELRKI